MSPKPSAYSMGVKVPKKKGNGVSMKDLMFATLNELLIHDFKTLFHHSQKFC